MADVYTTPAHYFLRLNDLLSYRVFFFLPRESIKYDTIIIITIIIAFVPITNNRGTEKTSKNLIIITVMPHAMTKEMRIPVIPAAFSRANSLQTTIPFGRNDAKEGALRG